MTKTLNTLIKLNKNKLDQILKEIKLKETQKITLEERRRNIIENVNKEIEQYSSTEFSFVLEKYVESAYKLVKQIDIQTIQLEKIIINLRNDLNKQYSELKKFEIVRDNRESKRKEKEKTIENKLFDEFNISRFSFNKNNNAD